MLLLQEFDLDIKDTSNMLNQVVDHLRHKSKSLCWTHFWKFSRWIFIYCECFKWCALVLIWLII